MSQYYDVMSQYSICHVIKFWIFLKHLYLNTKEYDVETCKVYVVFFLGGWNNNPTATKFKAAFRSLMSHAGACPSGKTGNVQAQDLTELVRAATSAYIPPDLKRKPERDVVEMDYKLVFKNFHEIDKYSGNIGNVQYDSIIDNIVTYIAGFVVRRAFDEISCSVCKSLLVATQPKLTNGYLLLTIKNRGGLFIASKSVVSVLTYCEKQIRSVSSLRKLTSKTVEAKVRLQSQVLMMTSHMNLFDKTHANQTRCGIDDHITDLVKLLTNKYYDLRFHHITNLHGADLVQSSVRSKLNRSVIFLGQWWVNTIWSKILERKLEFKISSKLSSPHYGSRSQKSFLHQPLC